MTRTSDLRSIRLVYESSRANKMAALKHGADYLKKKSNALKIIRPILTKIVHLIDEYDKVRPHKQDSKKKKLENSKKLYTILVNISNLMYEITDFIMKSNLLSPYVDREALAGLISVNIHNSLQRYVQDNDDKHYTIEQLYQDIYQHIANLIEQD